MKKNLDGSYTADGPVQLSEELWKKHPTKPNTYVPNFKQCKHRRIQLTIVKCKKVKSTWRCNLHNCNISVPFCNACNDN